MAPSSRRSRRLNKKYSNVNEVPSKKNGDTPRKSRHRKRKLSDMLGPQWSKEELERFYKAYRKNGQDWEKVAAIVRTRSPEMVEALYTMNRAYLSLPKGYASAAGLIAMMTDHYSNFVDSDSEEDVNEDGGVSRKPPKRARGIKDSDGLPAPDLSPSKPVSSDEGCLSLLKKRRYVGRAWAVGKRTPRVPVSFPNNKDYGDNYLSPIRRGIKLKSHALDDDFAHEIALALAEASQIGGSPQVSRTPNKKSATQSPVHNGELPQVESEMKTAKVRKSELDEGGYELSLGSTDADMGDVARDKMSLKRKASRNMKPELEESMDNHLDIKEACSGTEEGQKMGSVKGKLQMDDMDTKLARTFSKGLRKRSNKVLFGEVVCVDCAAEDAAFDALQALADLSLRLPETPADTESSVDVKDERIATIAKSKLKGNFSNPGVKVTSSKTSKQEKAALPDVTAIPKANEIVHQETSGIRKRRQKPLAAKISEQEECSGSHFEESQKVEDANDQNDFCKGKDVHPKQGKMKHTLHTFSNADHGRGSSDLGPSPMRVLSTNELNLPTKVRSRRKVNTPKPSLEKDIKSSIVVENGVSDTATIIHDRALNLKKKLVNCLSLLQVQQWCVFEWFYSAIDYPWFAKREFVEYLDHVGLGHIPKLTRVEWGVIRSSLGKPRRFSKQFLKEEKEKLHQYRESVRKHYSELRAGSRDGLPTDLAQPLSVGQHVIARHPRTREIHDGSVLTVDDSRCRIQFDQPELGVEFVMDVDCMPLNPLENMPTTIAGHSFPLSKPLENGLKSHGSPTEKRVEGFIPAPSDYLESTNCLPHASATSYHVDSLLQQAKGVLASSNTPIKVGSCEIHNDQPAANLQPSIDLHIQAKEADIQALSELNRALDKKEAVVSELKRMNDEVLENQKDGVNPLKESEPFKKHYAAVILQLNEVNEQVSSALLCLRQRNTYQGNTTPLWFRPMTSLGEPLGLRSCYDAVDGIQESGSHVVEIVESSRTKAQTMVAAAVQAMSSFYGDGNSIQSVEDAIDLVNNQINVDDLSMPAVASASANSVHGASVPQDQSSSCTENPGTTNHEDTKLNNLSNQSEAQIPSELIAECVATLLMIQRCTERQFPPSDVAQVLDTAVTSLKPCCPQNLPVYAEIQKCMGIIRNQILALVPT